MNDQPNDSEVDVDLDECVLIPFRKLMRLSEIAAEAGYGVRNGELVLLEDDATVAATSAPPKEQDPC
jgi:hypothetical protein